jgi:hypothetical protein
MRKANIDSLVESFLSREAAQEPPSFDQSVLSKWGLTKPVWQKESLQLQKMKLKKRTDGTLNSSLVAAAAAAKAQNITCIVWQGNSYMHAMWNVSFSSQRPPVSFERINSMGFIVTPDLNFWRCEFKD